MTIDSHELASSRSPRALSRRRHSASAVVPLIIGALSAAPWILGCSVRTDEGTPALNLGANAQAVGASPLLYGASYHLQNGYNAFSGGYLDTRGAGCADNALCVSTSSSDDRDTQSGTWLLLSASGKKVGSPVLSGDRVYLANAYPRGTSLDSAPITTAFGGYLDTRGRNCADNLLCVSTSWSANRDSGSGTWTIESASATIGEGDSFTLLNGYDGNGGYLDTRGRGCDDNLLCVSTSTSPNRDSGSGTWRMSISVPLAPNPLLGAVDVDSLAEELAKAAGKEAYNYASSAVTSELDGPLKAIATFASNKLFSVIFGSDSAIDYGPLILDGIHQIQSQIAALQASVDTLRVDLEHMDEAISRSNWNHIIEATTAINSHVSFIQTQLDGLAEATTRLSAARASGDGPAATAAAADAEVFRRQLHDSLVALYDAHTLPDLIATITSGLTNSAFFDDLVQLESDRFGRTSQACDVKTQAGRECYTEAELVAYEEILRNYYAVLAWEAKAAAYQELAIRAKFGPGPSKLSDGGDGQVALFEHGSPTDPSLPSAIGQVDQQRRAFIASMKSLRDKSGYAGFGRFYFAQYWMTAWQAAATGSPADAAKVDGSHPLRTSDYADMLASADAAYQAARARAEAERSARIHEAGDELTACEAEHPFPTGPGGSFNPVCDPPYKRAISAMLVAYGQAIAAAETTHDQAKSGAVAFEAGRVNAHFIDNYIAALEDNVTNRIMVRLGDGPSAVGLPFPEQGKAFLDQIRPLLTIRSVDGGQTFAPKASGNSLVWESLPAGKYVFGLDSPAGQLASSAGSFVAALICAPGGGQGEIGYCPPGAFWLAPDVMQRKVHDSFQGAPSLAPAWIDLNAILTNNMNAAASNITYEAQSRLMRPDGIVDAFMWRLRAFVQFAAPVLNQFALKGTELSGGGDGSFEVKDGTFARIDL